MTGPSHVAGAAAFCGPTVVSPVGPGGLQTTSVTVQSWPELLPQSVPLWRGERDVAALLAISHMHFRDTGWLAALSPSTFPLLLSEWIPKGGIFHVCSQTL